MSTLEQTWEALPPQIRAHPGIKALHRAALSAQPAAEEARPVLYIPRAIADGDRWIAGELRTNEVDERPFACSEGWECLPLYAAPPARPVAPAGWLPMDSAPENMQRPVVVVWINDYGAEQHDIDYTEDGCWMRWHDQAEHAHMVGGHGVKDTPPYQGWMPLPPLAASPAAPAPGNADEQAAAQFFACNPSAALVAFDLYRNRSAAPAQVPLTEQQAVALWHENHDAHERTSAFEWFAAGIIAGERAHGITAPSGAEG